MTRVRSARPLQSVFLLVILAAIAGAAPVAQAANVPLSPGNVDVSCAPGSGVAADFIPSVSVIAVQADGRGIINDAQYEVSFKGSRKRGNP